MKKLIFTRWTLMRFIRLIAGITAITFAVLEGQPLLGVAGLFLSIIAVFNMQPCFSGACTVPSPKQKK
ncbi:hypothetical protein [Chitinophaga sancti]|uniref:DUF2892 domain-containing protein n=1 Tax=Chitinophaga sancti TaxID=1004 RepID=A0A1K1SQW0_9BACT|nr:hypothetical protein [Chitinophaga sancti]WQD65342.1 hypothetical protein U0033_13150 [Chitinophaga sancti]WQG89034.1 hypothetical protein SR876_29320 [Chitinophaga sancti]SFW86800.1 hypothetical protein SAMN05661012_05963 [Chitinophaga sancti]